MGRISYFQMEISLGRWNTKLFLGRRSYLLSKKRVYKRIQDYSKNTSPSNMRCPDPPGIEPAGFFSRRPIWQFWVSKNKNWTSWENLKPHPLNQKNKEKIREIETIQTNESYHTMFQSNLRCPDLPGIEPAVFFLKTSNLSLLAAKKSKRASWEKVWWLDFLKTSNGQKAQKQRLEKRFGGSIPGASWKRFSYPAVLNHILPYIYSFSRTRQESSHQTFSQDALFGFLAAKKLKLDFLRK